MGNKEFEGNRIRINGKKEKM